RVGRHEHGQVARPGAGGHHVLDRFGQSQVVLVGGGGGHGGRRRAGTGQLNLAAVGLRVRLPVVEGPAGDDRGGQPVHLVGVAVVAGQHVGAAAHVDADRGEVEPARVDRLLPVADQQQAVRLLRIDQGGQQPYRALGQVLRLVDDDRVVERLVQVPGHPPGGQQDVVEVGEVPLGQTGLVPLVQVPHLLEIGR